MSLVVLIALNVSACMQLQADTQGRQPVSGQSSYDTRVHGEYVVRLVAGSDPADVMELLSDYGIAQWRQIRKDTYLVRLRSDPGPDALADLARDSTWLRSVEPNRIYTTQ